MTPHPRIRKTIKWGGAAVTVLLVVAWFASGWRPWTAYPGTEFVLNLSEGRVSLTRMVSAEHRDFLRSTIEMVASFATPRHWKWYWWCSFDGKGPFQRWDISVPLWFLAAAMCVPTLAAWRLDTLARQRARVGFCPKCSYDRTGLAASATCPECGAANVPS